MPRGANRRPSGAGLREVICRLACGEPGYDEIGTRQVPAQMIWDLISGSRFVIRTGDNRGKYELKKNNVYFI